MKNIQEKVVIITGASSGMGESTAKLLASYGAKIVVAARREERLIRLTKEIENAGGSAIYKVTDVTSYQQVQDLAQFALESYGKIDVIINNAGFMPVSPLHAQKVEEWDQMIDINIKGVLYGISAVLPYMRKYKKGQIINVASALAHVVVENAAVYAGTKYAVKAITEGLRQEECENNIRTTLISPGAVQTEITNSITHEETKAAVKENVSKVWLQPESIAKAIAYSINEPDEVSTNEIIVRPTIQKEF
ncbi:SDR family oxidoreductase [Tetragenococcus solitarius]|uniref:SDR family oxidoreductase n=1 Tax=Tetragenococcus solitarius TaxID=71453 RepID=A0ABN3Y991_9ENTE|nr:SDR family oxidoreductase [Tetragenococcus solitarius]